MKKLKLITIILLVSTSILLIYFFRSINEHEVLITHVLYIPVILIAFWWQYRVIYVVILFGILLIIPDIHKNTPGFIVHDILRMGLLLFAAVFVAAMKGYIVRFSSFRKYRDILFAVQEPMVIVDPGFNVVINNKKFSEIFSIEKSGSILSLFNNIVQDDSLYDAITACFNGEETVYEGSFATAKGDTRLFEIRCYPLSHDEKMHYSIMNFRDITEEFEFSLRQRRALDRQKVVINILELLNSRESDPLVIRDILALITENTGIEALGLKLQHGEGFRLHSSAGFERLTRYLQAECSCDSGEDDFCIRRHGFMPVLGRETACEQADDIFFVNDLDEYAFTGSRKICRCMIESGIRSFAVIPTYSGENVIGFFLLLDRRKNFFSSELLDFFKGIAQSIGIALDRVRYEDNLRKIINEKELLIREVHHRVKNNMQVITSLISLQATRQSDENVRSILNECQNRVRTMALVHEKLYSSNNYTSINFGSYINSLVPILMNSYRIDKDHVRVKITADDIQLGINTAIPLAQLVNEILSNVFKHAFPDSRRGLVEISLTRDTLHNLNRLMVKDTGTGFSEGIGYPAKGNLGFQLIEALVRQIKGRIEISNREGVSVCVEF